MTVKATVIGADKLQRELERRVEDSEDAVTRVINQWAVKAQRRMIKSIQGGTKTGHEYKRGGITHRASKSPEPPATDTGNLVRSIQIKPAKVGSTPVAFVVAGTEYAKWLEFGTSKMKPRPFMEPAVKATMPESIKAIRADVRRALK